MTIRRYISAVLLCGLAAHLPAAEKAMPAAEPTPLQVEMDGLKSPDVNRRRQAAEELSRLRDTRAIPALLIALSDEDASVRSASARTLGLIRSPDATAELTRVLRQDPNPNVRQAAAAALGMLADETATPALIDALKDGDMGTRLAAAQALAGSRSPEAAAALKAGLDDPSPEFRRQAVARLGDMGNPAAAPNVRPFLKDPDPKIRAAALKALGQLRDEASIPAMRKFLHKKNPMEVRLAAAQSLAAMRIDAGRETALAALQDRELNPELRLEAVRVFLTMPDADLLPDVRRIYEEEKDESVKAALQSLVEKLSSPS